MPGIRASLSIWLLFWIFWLPLPAQTGSLHFVGTPLSEALKTLAQEQHVLIAFPERAVSPYSVTLNLNPAASLNQNLQLLLRGTDLTFRELENGQFIISSQRTSPEQTRGLPPKTTYTLRGFVLDATSGEPLSQATIRIPGTRLGTYTNEQGYFLLADLPQRYDSLEVRYLGYLTQTIAFTPASPVEIKMTLVQRELEDVVISEGSDQVVTLADAASQLTLNPRRIQALSGLGEPDVLRALQFLPGIHSGDESAAGLHIRGGRPEENMVMFDGITVYQPGHLFGNFSAFNPQAVKELSVQRGGFDARYGGRISGVIDITGRPEQMQKASGELGINLMSSNAFFQVPFWKNKGAVMVAFRRSSSQWLDAGFYSALTQNVLDSLHLSRQSSGQPSLSNIPDFQFSDFNTKVVLRPSDRDFISLSAYLAKDNLQYQWKDGITSEEWFLQSEKTVLRNQGLSLNWKRQWNQRYLSKLTAAWSSFDNLFQIKQSYNLAPAYINGWDQGNGIRDLSIRLDQELQLNATQRLDFGVHATHFSLDSMLHFLGDGDLQEYQNEANLLSAYAQYAWQPDARLSLTLGGRWDYYTGTQKGYAAPRLSFRYQLSPHLYLKGVWGYYYQYLNRTEMGSLAGLAGDYWTLANGTSTSVLGAEHFILGAAYEAKGWLIDAEIYQKNISGLISYVDALYSIEDFTPILFKDGTGVARGMDLMVQKKIGPYTAWVSYSLSEVRYRFPELIEAQFFPASHDQRHQLSLVNLLQKGHWDFAVNWIFASGRPYSEAERVLSTQLIGGDQRYYIGYGPLHGARMKAYHRLDVSATLTLPTWKDRIDSKVGVSIFNLYNRQNQSDILYRVRSPHSEEAPSIIQLEKNLLGITPNLFVNFSF